MRVGRADDTIGIEDMGANMTHIPKDAEWYIAELICEIRVEGESGNVVHRNFILVNAASPDDAYQKALMLGSSSEVSYNNPEEKQVSIHFRGLGDLNVIHDKLEHGAELMYSEEADVSQEDLNLQIRDKSDLAVFRTESQSVRLLDYQSQEVLRQVEQIVSEKE